MVPDRKTLHASIFRTLGKNIDDRDKPVLERSNELNNYVGNLMGLQRAYDILPEHMDLLIEGSLGLIDYWTRRRVDLRSEPEPEEEDLL